MKPLFAFSLFSLSTVMTALSAQAAEVQVAVAANFTAPLQEIAAQFAKDTGHHVVPAFGATGQLYAQISHGAPFELLLSADSSTPSKLASEGLAAKDGQYTYAIGKLVLWSADPKLLDGTDAVLKANQFLHLAVANAKAAPYGLAAIQVLQKLGLSNAVQPKLVEGQSISQTLQFVSSGSAELGFVALSQVYKGGKLTEGSAWEVPQALHEPIKQDVLLLKKAEGNPAAQAFFAYLRGPQAQQIISAYGYQLP
ncbi:molybdate ABC transporter substrate-binding protein [Pseudomonas sp. 5P_3.1_Bac2]|uniref:molybdate ABC transporter substrate-binding protein n=1 Tax=Pseudomonas sp. 5P_3.1_Bac2 TaxID=2971617 RepID=UPI0021C58823|nr:molybdate ABC transporter substrate-binding protein [Pseudomonas sp. 5P_3.1_Bac2]MCU1719088.1 molybdate ABC transporter substrate-binding protein [Pseudomonas sp. 5P_3.1_Bac2]